MSEKEICFGGLGLRTVSLLGCILSVTTTFSLGQTSVSLGPSKSINALLEDGSDIGQQINAAAAQLPLGGEVYVPAAASCYQFSTPIVINSPIILRGDGPGTCLEYTGSSGTALTWTGAPGPSFIAAGWGAELRDISLQTPAAVNGSVDGTTAIFLNQLAGFQAYNVNVSGFGTGILFSSNTFLLGWHGGIFRHNRVALNYPYGITNAGENMTFSHTTFANGTQTDGVSSGQNCILLNVTPNTNSSEFNFENVSFDGCQVVIGENWEASTRFINPHFEDVQDNLSYPFLKVMTGSFRKSNVVLTNPNFILDATGAKPDAFIELNNNASVDISNGTAQGWGGISAPNAWISIKGAGNAQLATRGIFYIVRSAGQIPLYKTDEINQPQIDVTRPSNVLSVPMSSDGDIVLAQGVLTGDYWITWGDQNERHQAMMVSVSTSNYSSSAAVNILSNYAFAGNVVISGIRAVTSGGVPQLVATVSNRNGASGPLTVQWSGTGVYQPQILPGTAVGSTTVANYGIQQTPDGVTTVSGGMKLSAGSRPTCNSSNGGLFWYLQGQPGTADNVEICTRDASGTYAWRSVSLTLDPDQSGGSPGGSPGPHVSVPVLRGQPIYPRSLVY